MIDTKRAMTGTMLTTPKDADLAKPFDIVEQLLAKDLGYTVEDEVDSSSHKDEPGLEEELEVLDSGPLEMDNGSLGLEELPGEQEELAPLPATGLEGDSVIHIPVAAVEEDRSVRRTAMRRRRTEDQDENAATPADAGESDAV